MSKPEKNLEAAFAGGSMTRNRYTYFAKDEFKLLHGISDTAANLKESPLADTLPNISHLPTSMSELQVKL